MALEHADDETATQFFSSHPPAALDESFADESPLARRRSLVPPARRARHLRIVKTAVLVCSMLCVTAGVRVVVTQRSPEPLATIGMATARAEAPPAPPPPPPPEPAPVAVVAPPPPALYPNARAATRAALAALESRRVDDAIAAASEATTLDAADGEAWLVLG